MIILIIGSGELSNRITLTIKSEYDRLIGELSQTTITPGTRDLIERRKRDIKTVDQGGQYIKNIQLPLYIECQIYTESIMLGLSPVLLMKSFLK